MAPTPLIPSPRDNAVALDALEAACEYIESAIEHDLPNGPARDLHAALFVLYGAEEALGSEPPPAEHPYGTVTAIRSCQSSGQR